MSSQFVISIRDLTVTPWPPPLFPHFLEFRFDLGSGHQRRAFSLILVSWLEWTDHPERLRRLPPFSAGQYWSVAYYGRHCVYDDAKLLPVLSLTFMS